MLVGNTLVLDESSDSTTVTPISSSEEGYGLQSSATVVIVDSGGSPTTNTVKGGIAFANGVESKKESSCSDNFDCYYGYWTDDTSDHSLLSKYGTSYPAYVFDSNSLLYKPLENYKNYLKNTLGKTSVTTRLITYEEVMGFGCHTQYCDSIPSWMYNTYYWSGSAVGDDWIYEMDVDGYFYGYYFNDNSIYGLRPVITINKSEL